MAQAIGSSLIPFTGTEHNGSIHRRFNRIVQLVPDQIAVNTLAESLTYSELAGLSDHIAAVVNTRSRSPKDTLTAIFLDQGHQVMAAILGILKSGRVVVPLSSDSPLDKLQYQWQETFNPAVITDRQNLAYVREFVTDPDKLICLDDLDDGTGIMKESPSFQEPQGDDLAMISYTSGSTGMPKGVMQSHRMILQTARQNQISYQLKPGDRSVVLASLGYGAAKTQSFATLLSGGTLYLPDLRQWALSPLIERLHMEEITILAMPPFGLFRQILEVMSAGHRLSTLRLALLGGDDLYQKDIDQFFSMFNLDTSLVYRFAGSEMNLISEIHLHPGMKFIGEKVPVGVVVPDKEIWLEDETGKEVRVGEMGEIVVRSRYLASGYWRQPELTAERFKSDSGGGEVRIYYTGDLGRINEQGQLEHLGRKDNMVKVHGYSVHLETVDEGLGRLTDVKEGAVAAVPLPEGDKRLVAYLVPAGGNKPPVGEIRRELAQILPEHMQPSVFVWLEKLPRTSTGKLDRKAFPAPPRVRPDVGGELVAPRDEREAGLVEIWKRILQLDEVGVEDNFFDLGGDSLSSVQMVVEAERQLGFTLPKSYFDKPTIANLVERYEEWVRGEGEGRQDQGEGRAVEERRRGRKVSKYQAAVRKILRGEWSPVDISRKIKWSGDSLLLSSKDHSIRKSVLISPYRHGLETLSHWASSTYVTKRLYPDLFQVYTQLLQDLDNSPSDYEAAFKASIMGNVFSRLGLHAYLEKANNDFATMLQLAKEPFWNSLSSLMANSTIKELDELFPIYNREYLERAYKAGRGVILLSYHSTVNRLALLTLTRRFYGETIPTISEKRARRESIHWQNNYARDLPVQQLAALKAGVALEGQHLLSQGKIVQFVSDNEYARQGHAVTIARRIYYLRPGFAELALNTGAAVVPMYNCMKLDGRIHMTFLPPLLAETGVRESQIGHLLDQYAAFINDSWSVAPESIRWPRMLRHFDQPLVY